MNSLNIEVLQDVSKLVEEVCDLLNRETDRVYKKM